MLLPKARLSLSHATSQPQLFCHSSVSISVHIKSTHSLSIPAHPFCFILRLLVKQRTVFTHLTLLPSRHPSSGTLTKHTPGTPTSLKLGPARGFFHPDRPVHSPQSFAFENRLLSSLRLACTNEHANLPAFFQSKFWFLLPPFTRSSVLFRMVGDGNGMEMVQPCSVDDHALRDVLHAYRTHLPA